MKIVDFYVAAFIAKGQLFLLFKVQPARSCKTVSSTEKISILMIQYRICSLYLACRYLQTRGVGEGGGSMGEKNVVVCLTCQQHASVSQGWICSDNFTCCHTEIEVADQTFHLTHSQYTDTRPTSPRTGPVRPSAWQGSHWSANA